MASGAQHLGIAERPVAVRVRSVQRMRRRQQSPRARASRAAGRRRRPTKCDRAGRGLRRDTDLPEPIPWGGRQGAGKPLPLPVGARLAAETAPRWLAPFEEPFPVPAPRPTAAGEATASLGPRPPQRRASAARTARDSGPTPSAARGTGPMASEPPRALRRSPAIRLSLAQAMEVGIGQATPDPADECRGRPAAIAKGVAPAVEPALLGGLKLSRADRLPLPGTSQRWPPHKRPRKRRAFGLRSNSRRQPDLARDSIRLSTREGRRTRSC